MSITSSVKDNCENASRLKVDCGLFRLEIAFREGEITAGIVGVASQALPTQ